MHRTNKRNYNYRETTSCKVKTAIHDFLYGVNVFEYIGEFIAGVGLFGLVLMVMIIGLLLE